LPLGSVKYAIKNSSNIACLYKKLIWLNYLKKFKNTFMFQEK
jgi:hypothetical protein